MVSRSSHYVYSLLLGSLALADGIFAPAAYADRALSPTACVLAIESTGKRRLREAPALEKFISDPQLAALAPGVARRLQDPRLKYQYLPIPQKAAKERLHQETVARMNIFKPLYGFQHLSKDPTVKKLHQLFSKYSAYPEGEVEREVADDFLDLLINRVFNWTTEFETVHPLRQAAEADLRASQLWIEPQKKLSPEDFKVEAEKLFQTYVQYLRNYVELRNTDNLQHPDRTAEGAD